MLPPAMATKLMCRLCYSSSRPGPSKMTPLPSTEKERMLSSFRTQTEGQTPQFHELLTDRHVFCMILDNTSFIH